MENKQKKLLVLCIFLLLLSYCCSGYSRQQIDNVISSSSQKKVDYSVHIINADTGKVIYSHKGHKQMIPASNMKIIVSSAALRILGVDYVYKTAIGLCGDTLLVKGSGDPLLGDSMTDRKYSREQGWEFAAIAKALKEAGVDRIKDVLIDSTIFDDQMVHENWPRDQINRDYACEVSGLNYNDNCIDVTAIRDGKRVRLSLSPDTDYLDITNDVKVVSKGGAVGSYRTSKPNVIKVFGKCSKKAGPFAIAIEQPDGFFGTLVKENLPKYGVFVSGQIKLGPIECERKVREIMVFSTPLIDCLQRCNKNSFNLAAESLLKTLSAKVQGGRGSWQGGREVLSEYLKGLGIDSAEYNLDDGCGLSRENKISTNALTKVLRDMYKGDDWSAYKETLAVGGEDGTIKKYFKDEKYKGKIFGKTGYINGVKAFSGICYTDNGTYVFSILTNKANGKTRPAINNIVKALFD